MRRRGAARLSAAAALRRRRSDQGFFLSFFRRSETTGFLDEKLLVHRSTANNDETIRDRPSLFPHPTRRNAD